MTRSSVTMLRTFGALSVLVVGAVHIEQYFAVHFDVVPIIGPLFALNFAGATLIGIGLLLPLRRVRLLLALGGIGLAVTSLAFLLVSEHRPLFGFEDYGNRPGILIAIAAEAAAVLFLGGYLGSALFAGGRRPPAAETAASKRVDGDALRRAEPPSVP
jgi:hypothetical protein